jgi:hypothetical protein
MTQMVTVVRRVTRRMTAISPEHEALVALSLTLASRIDDEPPAYTLPNLSRELRLVLGALAAGQDGIDGELREILTSVQR